MNEDDLPTAPPTPDPDHAHNEEARRRWRIVKNFVKENGHWYAPYAHDGELYFKVLQRFDPAFTAAIAGTKYDASVDESRLWSMLFFLENVYFRNIPAHVQFKLDDGLWAQYDALKEQMARDELSWQAEVAKMKPVPLSEIEVK